MIWYTTQICIISVLNNCQYSFLDVIVTTALVSFFGLNQVGIQSSPSSLISTVCANRGDRRWRRFFPFVVYSAKETKQNKMKTKNNMSIQHERHVRMHLLQYQLASKQVDQICINGCQEEQGRESESESQKIVKSRGVARNFNLGGQITYSYINTFAQLHFYPLTLNYPPFFFQHFQSKSSTEKQLET